jgi:hypothetical protein
MILVEHTTHVVEMINLYKNLVGKPEEKEHLNDFSIDV